MFSDDLTGDRFWKIICGFKIFWWMLVILNVIFAVLLLFALLFIKSPASSIIALIDAGIVVVTLTGLILVIWKCDRRERSY